MTPISDPIHTRIELTLFDRNLVDSSLFQRLHFVLQNSVNYVSFPTNKNTRFPHSLGTAHSCGLLFSHGLSNAQTQTLRGFLKHAADFFDAALAVLAKRGSPVGGREVTPQELHDKYRRAHRATISGRASFLHAPLNQNSDKSNRGDRVTLGEEFGTHSLGAALIVDTLWQALRIYALAHDLGHLPMSHAFEKGLERVSATHEALGFDTHSRNQFARDYSKLRSEFLGERLWKINFIETIAELLSVDKGAIQEKVEGKELHEARSLVLYDLFLTKQSDATSGFSSFPVGVSKEDIDDYCNFIHMIALCIMLSEALTLDAQEKSSSQPHKNAFLFSIKKIVDGAVDGDRLDYTIRDIQETGTTYGSYDLDRIFRNSWLISCPKGNRFSFGFFHRAVPGIEQFFEARFQSYKYLIFHRTAARSNGCMEQIISVLFSYCYQFPGGKISSILNRYGFIKFGEDEEGARKPVSLLPIVETYISQVIE